MQGFKLKPNNYDVGLHNNNSVNIYKEKVWEGEGTFIMRSLFGLISINILEKNDCLLLHKCVKKSISFGETVTKALHIFGFP